MQETHETLSSGAIIRSRYLVVDLLGKGGFSAVYLVQDLQREDMFFALKEAITADRKGNEHFSLEYNLLERLVHPALPRVHHVFENEAQNRMYMLMDYIEGPNLETLRLIQHEKRFSFPVITAILAPVVDAIGYLHQQNPPIVHRDIKPANIIVPVVERKTLLVDFGIAKEFDRQGTTSAVRYGSHGYGAPEQYTAGTNTRTDIYGLGATLYTLLTGEIPPDALDRMTQFSNDKPDPLKPASELVPSIPLPASRAIGRAMSINMKQRFATVQEFWQAFQGESEQQPHITEALNSIAASPFASIDTDDAGAPLFPPPHVKQAPRKLSRKNPLLAVLLVLLLLAGIGASFWGYAVFRENQTATSQSPTPTATEQLTPASTATFPPGYPHLAASYNGSIDATAPLTLTRIQQLNNGQISGSFSGLNIRAPFIGLLGTSNPVSITFTVEGDSGHRPLSFTGVVQADGKLRGEYCEVDQYGSCSIDANGTWSAVPFVATP